MGVLVLLFMAALPWTPLLEISACHVTVKVRGQIFGLFPMNITDERRVRRIGMGGRRAVGHEQVTVISPFSEPYGQ